MQTEKRYFAYGSNLNVDDWDAWCQERGEDSGGIHAECSGLLADHRPVYHYRSVSRAAGALDVTPAIGHTTPGMLFRVSDQGWDALDRKEGHPHRYARGEVIVLREDGGREVAITYRVVPERRQEFTAPKPVYSELVRQGLLRWGLPTDAHDRAARNEPVVPMVRHLFVYGLLQSGHALGQTLRGIGGRRPAWIGGRLFDLGSYPGWQPADDPGARVHGEILELTHPAETLAETDRIEGYVDDTDRALYHRVLVRANAADGEPVLAWCYRRVDTAPAPLIPSGRWPRGDAH